MRSTSRRGSRATSTNVRLFAHQMAASWRAPRRAPARAACPQLKSDTGAPSWRYMMCATRPSPYRQRARPDELEPGSDGFSAGACASRMTRPSTAPPRPPTGACRTPSSSRSIWRDRRRAPLRARAPICPSLDTQTRRPQRRRATRRGAQGRRERTMSAAGSGSGFGVQGSGSSFLLLGLGSGFGEPEARAAGMERVRGFALAQRRAPRAHQIVHGALGDDARWHGAQTRRCSSTACTSAAASWPSTNGVTSGSID